MGGSSSAGNDARLERALAEIDELRATNATLRAELDRVGATPSSSSARSTRAFSLEDAKRLTGLGVCTVNEAFAVFASAADVGENLSIAAFRRCITQTAADVVLSNASDASSLERYTERLFAMFDLDGNGVIDFTELASGLSVLCSGTIESKARATFNLFDVNGDGVLSLDEMARYLASVFRVTFGSQQDAQSMVGAEGFSVEDLARATAEEAFDRAPLNAYGCMDYAAFLDWFLANSPKDAAAATGTVNPYAEDAGYVYEREMLDLDELRTVTGLGAVPLGDALAQFAEKCSVDGYLTREEFCECFAEAKAATTTTMAEEDDAAYYAAVDQLFDMFDADQNGLVDYAELGSGLSVLCAGSRDEKAQAAFVLYDYDGDGVISLDEMVRYLTPVFTIMVETDAGSTIVTNANAMASPRELALATALQAFADAGVAADAQLTWPQFRAWYLSTGDGVAAVSNAAIDVDALCRLTGINAMSVDSALALFVNATDRSGALSLEEFESCLMRAPALGVASLNARDASILHLTTAKLFSMFDEDGNGLVSFAELGAGLAMLCGGSVDEKARAAFNLYDINGDGVITLDEMTRYLLSVFTVMLEREPAAAQGVKNAKDLALMTAKEAFGDAGVAQRGKMTWLQFKAWYSSAQDDSSTASSPPPPPSRGQARPPPPPPRSAARASSPRRAGGAPPPPPPLNLEDARRLTGLGRMEMPEALEAFYSRVGAAGNLSRAAFIDCFNAIAPAELSFSDERRREAIVTKLFTMFDADSSGNIDYTEIGVGLSVLCEGHQHDKARAAFDLYDINGDGVISFDEMCGYLRSIFTVMFEANGTSREVMAGATLEEFAFATATEAFNEADANHDGSLTWDEFKNWYSAGGEADVEDASAEFEAHGFNLQEASDITGLGALSPQDAMDIFRVALSEEGIIGFETFVECFDNIVDVASLSPKGVARLKSTTSQLFTIFDVDRNGVIDFAELGSGLSVLCGGSRDEKARAAFALYDTDDDGVLSFDEMVNYFNSIFTIMFAASHTRVADGSSARDLAVQTAREAFAEADVDNNHVLSWSEFRAWYSPAGVSGDHDVLVAELIEPLDLDRASRLTGLGNLSPADAMEIFASALDPETGVVSFDDFAECINSTIDPSLITREERGEISTTIKQLFELFDADGNGVVDFTELGSGLSILCGGTREEKARAAFALFDDDGDGVISLPEMVRYFSSVFTVMFSTDSQHIPDGVSIEELATATAAEAFVSADTDGDGTLTWEEFQEWYTGDDDEDDDATTEEEGDFEDEGGDYEDPREMRVLAADVTSVGFANPMNTTSFDGSLDLDEVRRLTGLSEVSVDGTVGVFHKAAGEKGALDRSSFTACFEELVDLSKLSEPEIERLYAVVLPKLFTMFDTDKNGVIDFAELGSGLSVLCGGSREDKVRIAFQLYDYDGDGVITYDEMTRYLTSVFAVMYETNSGAQESAGGLLPWQLAATTAQEAFDEADPEGTGVLTWAQFNAWFPMGEESEDATAASDSMLTLDDLSRVTGLGNLSPVDAMKIFSKGLHRGSMTKPQFELCFESVLDKSALSTTELTQLHSAIDGVFEMFDVNHDGGIDFTELGSGLSVMCGGTSHDKARAAFDLFDVDKDGVISLPEMTCYFTSVFTVMYETNPAMGDAMNGVPANELAIATAIDAFAHADADHSGTLSWDEFQTWYSTTQTDESDETGFANPLAGSESAAAGLDLDEVRRLTGLSDASVDGTVGIFRKAAGETSALDIVSFTACFEELVDLSVLSEPEIERLYAVVLPKLFAMFDTDKNGVIDFTELGSGLSILCGGSREDKVRIAFQLYDYDGDGEITYEEMVRYLASVFAVMYETNPGAKESAGGMTWQELAEATAQEAFDEADPEGTGVLTWVQFSSWFPAGDDEEGATTVAKVNTAAVLDLNEVSRLTGLSGMSPAAAMALFYGALDRNGSMDFESFRTCFAPRFDELSKGDQMKLWSIIDSLYAMFDSNGDGIVEYSELATGLSVLCGGSRDEKARAAFALYDANGDGVISLAEMTRYLSSVFTMMFAQSASASTQSGVGELAFETANHAFEDAGVGADENLTWEQFNSWYSSQVPSAPPPPPPPRRSGSSTTSPRSGGGAPPPPPKRASASRRRGSSLSDMGVDLGFVRRVTGLSSCDPEDVIEEFAVSASDDGTISLAKFTACFDNIVDVEQMSSSDASAFHMIIPGLYQLFDADGDGTVDVTEIAAGISVLCGGDADDKARAVFDLYDANGDGVITLDEMQNYFSAVFKLMYETTHYSAGAQTGARAAALLARKTAIGAFNLADVDHDGTLTWDEFRDWYTSSGGGASASFANPMIAEEAESAALDLDLVRRLTGLGSSSIDTTLRVFHKAAGTIGTLNPNQFAQCFDQIVDQGALGEGELERLYGEVLPMLFQMFDTDNNGVIDLKELGSGLSVLCGGTREDKARIAFQLYDFDGDGVITFAEMTRYLTTVFEVMYQTNASAQDSAGGLSVGDLALATAREAFSEADADGSGSLTWDKFYAWFP